MSVTMNKTSKITFNNSKLLKYKLNQRNSKGQRKEVIVAVVQCVRGQYGGEQHLVGV